MNQDYTLVRYGDEELQRYSRPKYLIVREFTIPGINSKYYDVECRELMAGTDDLAGAFDLRDWYEKHRKQDKGGVTNHYWVMSR